MSLLHVLMLSDGRPGHYHLAEGVVLALQRRREIALERIEIRRSRLLPARFLRQALDLGCSPAWVLRAGYGLDPRKLASADLVVSAGGNTLAANIAAARRQGASNIFIGSLRGADPEHFSVVISSYQRHRDLPRHLVTLKPSPADPDRLGRPLASVTFGPELPPKRIGLLIGGDSGLFKFKPADWERLQNFVRVMSERTGARFLLSTSPRTPANAADGFARLAANGGRSGGAVEEFIDFRKSGPGTLPAIFAKADVIICTEDSSSMISEAVAARLPVVGVEPEICAYEDREQEYRDFMRASNWCRSIAIAELTPQRLLASLAEIRPLVQNPVDRLAEQLAERLPELMIGQPVLRDRGPVTQPQRGR